MVTPILLYTDKKQLKYKKTKMASLYTATRVVVLSRARDQEGAGGERHDQDPGGRGVDVHAVPASESGPPHHPSGAARQQQEMRFVLLLLHLPDVAGAGCGSLVAFLHLQRLQQALRREALAEMETPRVEIESGAHSPPTGSRATGGARDPSIGKCRHGRANLGALQSKTADKLSVRMFPLFKGSLVILSLRGVILVHIHNGRICLHARWFLLR